MQLAWDGTDWGQGALEVVVTLFGNSIRLDVLIALKTGWCWKEFGFSDP